MTYILRFELFDKLEQTKIVANEWTNAVSPFDNIHSI